MLKSDIIWPEHRRYKSRTEWEPIGFFSDCLCNTTHFDLMLGFFSSSAISVLANGFAVFLYNGGRMRLIVNDILTEEDKKAIADGAGDVEIPYFDVSDIQKIKETLSERDNHFFNCLAWLIRHNRLEIKIIAPKNGIGISHTKSGIFSDGINDGLTVSCDWDGDVDVAKIKYIKDDFEKVFQERDDTVVYLSADKIKTHITENYSDKSIFELLESEYNILRNQYSQNVSKHIAKALDNAKERLEVIIDKLKEGKYKADVLKNHEPHFPYPSGPRNYQVQAFGNWKDNKQKGLFAMATGTGKTITSLNCLLEIYKKLGYYKALILVPTITLVEQWEKECEKFNFGNVIKVCSKYGGWQTSLANIRMLELSDPNNKLSYVIISTYASFIRPANFLELNQFPKAKLLLIADEAHNMGGGLVAKRLNDIKYLRRIGLSATPERQFDEEGNLRLMSFFGCDKEFTFEYSMAEAIRNKALCKYYYYPHLVELTQDEMSQYIELSKKIAKIINRTDDDSREILKRLLLKRKQIIHKAENKKREFEAILKDHLNKTGKDDEDTLHLIDEYTRIVRDIDPHIVVRQFTSESIDRDSMLSDFANGNIDVLTSMKCLDEGVDVPRSELAIFCASTGNPRQFIQRRGRVLRTHNDKRYAVIHDLVVIPDTNFDPECYEEFRSGML